MDLTNDYEGFVRTIQTYLERGPLVVLGSGASIPFHLPSMSDLAKEIKDNEVVQSDPCYNDFKDKLANGLEAAIDGVSIQGQTQDAIRTVTWNAINSKDWEFFAGSKFTAPETLVELLRRLTSPSPNKATIVTTNYDRMAEYATDYLGASVVNGFEGNFIKTFELPGTEVRKRRIKSREKEVEIWKVHGSLDWFIREEDNRIISLPLSKSIPDGYSPLLIPPGRDKYNKTHGEPYRSIITEADRAFDSANSYLCIGYGFNDQHLQPKLFNQIASGKPIVVLVYKMTEACKKHIIQSGLKKYIVCECSDETHTKVYMNGTEKEFDGKFWSLDEFLKIWG